MVSKSKYSVCIDFEYEGNSFMLHTQPLHINYLTPVSATACFNCVGESGCIIKLGESTINRLVAAIEICGAPIPSIRCNSISNNISIVKYNGENIKKDIEDLCACNHYLLPTNFNYTHTDEIDGTHIYDFLIKEKEAMMRIWKRKRYNEKTFIEGRAYLLRNLHKDGKTTAILKKYGKHVLTFTTIDGDVSIVMCAPEYYPEQDLSVGRMIDDYKKIFINQIELKDYFECGKRYFIIPKDEINVKLVKAEGWSDECQAYMFSCPVKDEMIHISLYDILDGKYKHIYSYPPEEGVKDFCDVIKGDING